MNFKIVKVKFNNNSLFPIAVSSDGIPNSMLIDYLLLLRNKLDYGSRELYCRDLLLLFQFCFDRDITFKKRVKDLNFFNVNEIYSITEWYLKRNLTNKKLTVSASVYNRRNFVIRSFLKHVYSQEIEYSSYSLEQKISLKKSLKQSLDIFKLRGVAQESHMDLKGLDDSQQTELLKIIHPESNNNLFTGSHQYAVQWRNYVFILLLLRTGIRKGEALLLEFSDLHLESNSHIIISKKDNIKYDRERKPFVKTRGRHIPIDSNLSQSILYYIQFKRDKLLKNSADNDFLFISSADGGPMSVESPNKIFSKINQKIFSDKEIKFTPHILRNTFNNNLYKEMKTNAGTIDYDLMAYLNGWHPDSKMLSVYARKEILGSASSILVDRQNKYLNDSK